MTLTGWIPDAGPLFPKPRFAAFIGNNVFAAFVGEGAFSRPDASGQDLKLRS